MLARLLLLVCVSTVAVSASSEESLSALYSGLLADLLPTTHEKICLSHEAEMGLCAAPEFAMKLKDAVVACASAHMEGFGDMDENQLFHSGNCDLEHYINHVFHFKVCIMMEIGWIVEGDSDMGKIDYDAVSADLMASPIASYFKVDPGMQCQMMSETVDSIESLEMIVALIMEGDFEQFAMTATGRRRRRAAPAFNRKGSKESSSKESSESKSSGSKSSSSSSSSSSEEEMEMAALMVVFDGMPEEMILMIAQRMVFFSCVQEVYQMACSASLEELVLGNMMTAMGR